MEVQMEALASVKKRIRRLRVAIVIVIVLLLLLGWIVFSLLLANRRLFLSKQGGSVNVPSVAVGDIKVDGQLIELNENTIKHREGEMIDQKVCRYLAEKGLTCDLDFSLPQLTLEDNILSFGEDNQIIFDGWDTNVYDDVTKLTQLTDVDTRTPNDGQVLQFVNGVWKAAELKFTDLADTPADYSTPGWLLQTSAQGITYADPSSLGQWQRVGSEVILKNTGDSVRLRAGESLLIEDLVSGGVVFAGDNQAIVNSADLYWDVNNKLFGVGTNTPDATLSVVSDGYSPVFKVVGPHEKWESLPFYPYRLSVSIDNLSRGSVFNQVVYVIIDTSSLIAAGKMRNDCADIRVTKSDGITEVPLWVEEGSCNTSKTVIWFKSDLELGVNTFYIYYGNMDAVSVSSAEDVFLFFDTFDTFDAASWVVMAGTQPRVANGQLILDDNAIQQKIRAVGVGYINNVGVVARVRKDGTDNEYDATIALEDTAGVSGAYFVLDGVGGRDPTNYVHLIDKGFSTNITTNGQTITDNNWHVMHMYSDGRNLYGSVDYNTPFTNTTSFQWSIKSMYLALAKDDYPPYQAVSFDWVAMYRYNPFAASVGTEERLAPISTQFKTNFIINKGYVGINVDAPMYAFQVGEPGDPYSIAAANNWFVFSDARFKEDVATIPDALEIIDHLRGVKFKWSTTGRSDIGFIAQEINSVLPQVVTSNQQGYLAVDYAKLTPVLVEAIKELNATVQELQTQLNNVVGSDTGNINNALYWTMVNEELTSQTPVRVPDLYAGGINADTLHASVINASSLSIGDLTVDSTGNLVTTGEVLASSVKAGSVQADEAVVKSLTVDDALGGAGVVVLQPGQTQVEVSVPNLAESDIVMITPYTPEFVQYRVEVADGKFTLFVNKDFATPVRFGYFVVKVR